MIRIDGLSKHYGQVRALDDLSLEVLPGVVYGFLGPNGAGKTTTMRILSGLAKPTAGRAWVLDKEIGQAGVDVRSMLGVLPEEPAFYTWMTAREYLRDFVAPLYRLDRKTAGGRASELVEQVGLKKAADRRIGGFSRGMRQRLGLAAAMVHQPKVLLLDEPVSALDPAGRKEVLDLIESLSEDTTILLSTHILADVERVCDVIGIIDKGRMVLQERRQDLLERYITPLFEVETENGFAGWLDEARNLTCVENLSVTGSIARILVSDTRESGPALMASLLAHDVFVRRFEIVRPSLEDIFLRLTEQASLPQ
jgi:ABC-2 type transport system ATP-binding protein